MTYSISIRFCRSFDQREYLNILLCVTSVSTVMWGADARAIFLFVLKLKIVFCTMKMWSSKSISFYLILFSLLSPIHGKNQHHFDNERERTKLKPTHRPLIIDPWKFLGKRHFRHFSICMTSHCNAKYAYVYIDLARECVCFALHFIKSMCSV